LVKITHMFYGIFKEVMKNVCSLKIAFHQSPD